MMLVISGEKRFMAVDLANDPGIAGGATPSSPAVVIVPKRGEVPPATAIVVETPTAPTVSGTEVRFWADFVNVAPGRYIAKVTATLSNGETAKAEADIVVE